MSLVDEEPPAASSPPAKPTLRQTMASIRDGSWKPGPDEQITVATLQEGWHKTTGRVRSKGPRVAAAVIAVALCTGIGAEVLHMQAANQRFEAAQQDGYAQVAALQSDIDRASATAAHPAQQAAALRARVAAARTAADRVAAGQNAYAVLNVAAAAHASTADGSTATPAEQALADHRKQLAPDWSADSLIVSGAAAYSYSPAEPFPSTQLDPRWPWYLRYDGGTPSPANKYGWVTDAVWFAPDGGTATVLWRNLQRTSTPGTPSGTVLAWARATYHVATSTFSALVVTSSTAGAAHLSPTLSYTRYAPVGPGPSSSPSVPLPGLPSTSASATASAKPSTKATAAR